MDSARDAGRSKVNDGWANRLEFFVTTHFAPVWDLVQLLGPVRRQVNRLLVNRAILKMPTRPAPLSTKTPYSSWDSLTDRTFIGRHLPPKADPDTGYPGVERTADLFARQGDTVLCPKSTVLFAYFAQWFTDGFLRSDHSEPRDPRKTTSNHEIDLSQVYGPNAAVTRLLRDKEGGLLKSQYIGTEEYPPYLCEKGVIKPEFVGLSVVNFDELSLAQKNGLFAMGGDRANSQVGYTMLNVLFIREHNRVARLLARDHPEWDNERLFETTRNILIVLLIKVVVSEYINHITPYHFKFFLDASAFPNERWHRPNWMAIEFNLLYRWHSLVPSKINIGEEELPMHGTIFNNELLVRRGLGPLFEDSSNQRAGKVGLFNTDPALRETEIQSIVQARQVHLASYNDYRANCQYPRVTDFDQISGDPAVQSALRDVYGSVANIEFYTGLFAEDVRPNSVLPSLIGRMVGIDAFSQALTNPLLAPRVFTEETFSRRGMHLINETKTLSDLLHRNLADGSQKHFVSLTRRGWHRE